MDRNLFFSTIRTQEVDLFGGVFGNEQVQGIEGLLDVMQGWPVDHVAHVLAEVYRETGGGMWPVKETVYRYSRDRNPSDATVIARLDRAWQRGQLSGVKAPYWRGGMFGRGQIQITHDYNYRKASTLPGLEGYDFTKEPGRVLELHVSATIAAEGCRIGIFRGKKLADFEKPDGSFDHFNARSIVNGDKNFKNDRGVRIGQEIADNAAAFTRALKAAGWGTAKPKPQVIAKPVETYKWNWLTDLITAITGLFGRNKK